MESDEDGFGREELAEGGDMGIKSGVKVSVWGDEGGEKNLFAIKVET